MTFVRPFLFFLSVFCSFPAFAAEHSVEKVVLDNGLTVLMQSMPSAVTVSVYAYVKAGSATEGQLLGTGVSHFVEHMLFKGTARRKVGQIAREVKAFGGSINAQTSFDYTMVTLDMPAASLDKGLDIISDMVMNSSFDEAQVEKERPVIQSEMRLYKDRPERVLSELVFQQVYIQHPYRHPIIGYEPLFDQVTRDQLFRYYKSRYIPNNIIISLAGSFDPQEALARIKELFKDFKPRAYLTRSLPQEPPQITPRTFKKEYPTPLTRFSLSYQGVSELDEDLYALDVLAMALGQGESSRLYREVYQRAHLVDAINASNFTPQDKGFFEIEVLMHEDNTSKVLEAIRSVLQGVKQKGLSLDELEKTKRQVLSQFVFSNQTSHGLAYRNAIDEAMTGDVQFSRHYVRAVDKVSNEDIMRVARKYLDDQRSTIVVLSPQKDDQEQQPEKVRPQTVFQKFVLGNGLTVLLKEDHDHPLVSLQLVMNAGTRQETDVLNGLSELTARVWSKGIQGMDDQALAQALESRGASLNTFAGRNSLGIKMDLLSEDLDFGLKILGGEINSPSFDKVMIEQERRQILTAIDGRDDQISSVAFKELFKTLFLTHPLRLDSLGTKETVGRIKREDILGYYKRFAVPSNMVLSIVGDFDASKVMAQLSKVLGGLKAKQAVLGKFLEEPPRELRRKELSMDKEQAMVAVAFQAPVIHDQDRWAMEVIDGILGSSLSGRIFVAIRDELGKAYTLGSQYIPSMDAGIFVIYVLTTPEKTQTVQDIIWREIKKLDFSVLSRQELDDARAYLKGNFVMSLDTPSALASLSSLDELYGLGYDQYEHYGEKLDAVAEQDVQRVARQYLDTQKAAIVVINGKKMIE